MSYRRLKWKTRLVKIKRKFLFFVYPLWAIVASRKRMDKLNKESLEAASAGNGEITVILHGIFTNYYSAVYWAVRWFKRSNINAISIGYDYKTDLLTSGKVIKEQMDDIMSRYDIKKVNMIGISLGGQVARTYIESLGGKDIVSRLVTVFSPLVSPKKEDFSIAKTMDELAGDKEITKRSLEQTILMQESFSISHLAIQGTSDLIIGDLATPAVESENLTLVKVRGGHTLVSYNVTAMEYAHMFVMYGKDAINTAD